MFAAALPIMAKTWKQPARLSTGKRVSKVPSLRVLGYRVATERSRDPGHGVDGA